MLHCTVYGLVGAYLRFSENCCLFFYQCRLYTMAMEGARTCVSKFDVHVTVHRDTFLIIKRTGCTNFSNLFWNESLHVSESSSVHNQEFFTVHTAMVYVIQVMLTAC